MQDVDKCPFCSQETTGEAKGGAGGFYRFNCPACKRFDVYNVTFRRLSNGEYADRKPQLLEFIKRTPEDTIAYFGQRQEGDDLKALYCEYRPL